MRISLYIIEFSGGPMRFMAFANADKKYFRQNSIKYRRSLWSLDYCRIHIFLDEVDTLESESFSIQVYSQFSTVPVINVVLLRRNKKLRTLQGDLTDANWQKTSA